MNIFLTPVFMTDLEVTKFMNGLVVFIQSVGGYIVIIAGILALIIGIIQISAGIASGGKSKISWPASIGCLALGGALMFGGWGLIAQYAGAAGTLIEEVNNNSNANGTRTLHDDKLKADSLNQPVGGD